MLVEDIMTRSPVTVKKGDSIKTAAELMRRHNIGILPVTDGKTVIGVITDRDITTRAVILSKKSEELSVGDFLSPSTAFISPKSTLKDASKLMSTLQIKRLLVMDRGVLLGIVSLSDITKASDDVEISRAICEIFDF